MQTTTAGTALALDHSAVQSAVPSGWILVALAPLIYVFMPRPPIPGIHRLVFPLSAGVLALLVFVVAARRPVIDRRILEVLLLLLLGNIALAFSFWLNAGNLRAAAVLELLRPGMLAMYLLTGYYAAHWAGDAAVRLGLLRAAQWILIGQAVIAVTQIAGVPLFDVVYSEEKTRPLGSLLRATGSLGNPNFFGWVVAQTTLAVLVLGRSRRLLWLLLGAALVLSSGSRSTVLLFPVVLGLGFTLRHGARLRDYLGAGALAAVVMGAFAYMVISFGEYFPYLAQLGQLTSPDSIESVRSLAVRLNKWAFAYQEFQSGGGLTWFLGLGSREFTRSLDNDYFYVLFRMGFVGLLFHAILVTYLALRFLHARTHPIGVLGLVYTLTALLLGIAFETLGGWSLPLMLLYLAGIAIGLRLGSRSRSASSATGTYGLDSGSTP